MHGLVVLMLKWYPEKSGCEVECGMVHPVSSGTTESPWLADCLQETTYWVVVRNTGSFVNFLRSAPYLILGNTWVRS
jgi:hypothetical protein